MNLLTEAAPKTVSIAGVEVPIRWDFRTSVRFEQLMEEDLPDEEKLTPGPDPVLSPDPLLPGRGCRKAPLVLCGRQGRYYPNRENRPE